MANRSAASVLMLILLVACGGNTEADSREPHGASGAGGEWERGAAGDGGAAEVCVVDATLPSCAFVASCEGSVVQCSVSADCTITVDEPVPSPSFVSLGCEDHPDFLGWSYGETDRTLYLSPASCDAWHTAGKPPIRIEFIHSCIL